MKKTMDKKYDSPAMEVVAMVTEGVVLAASVVNEKLDWDSGEFVM